jgi:hypothetical protein
MEYTHVIFHNIWNILREIYVRAILHLSLWIFILIKFKYFTSVKWNILIITNILLFLNIGVCFFWVTTLNGIQIFFSASKDVCQKHATQDNACGRGVEIKRKQISRWVKDRNPVCIKVSMQESRFLYCL